MAHGGDDIDKLLVVAAVMLVLFVAFAIRAATLSKPKQAPDPPADAAPEWNTGSGVRRLVAIDVETTGLSEHDHIVTLAIVACDVPAQGLVPSAFSVGAQHLVFNPGVSNHPKAQALHGWDDAVLAHQPPIASERDAIIDNLTAADLLCGHNLAFDLAFLVRDLPEAAPLVAGRAQHCTMLAARQLHPGLPASLDAVATRHNLWRMSGRHSALEDAYLALAITLAQRRGVTGLPIFAALREMPRQPTNYCEPPAAVTAARRTLPALMAAMPTKLQAPDRRRTHHFDVRLRFRLSDDPADIVEHVATVQELRGTRREDGFDVAAVTVDLPDGLGLRTIRLDRIAALLTADTGAPINDLLGHARMVARERARERRAAAKAAKAPPDNPPPR